MGSLVLMYSLGYGDRCIIEKYMDGWRLRVWSRGRTVATHPVEDAMVARLLSAPGTPRLTDLIEQPWATVEASPTH